MAPQGPFPLAFHSLLGARIPTAGPAPTAGGRDQIPVAPLLLARRPEEQPEIPLMGDHTAGWDRFGLQGGPRASGCLSPRAGPVMRVRRPV